MIKRDFGSFEAMKERMSGASVAVQGSGWGWLGYNKTSGRLELAACANQDPLEATTGMWMIFIYLVEHFFIALILVSRNI